MQFYEDNNYTDDDLDFRMTNEGAFVLANAGDDFIQGSNLDDFIFGGVGDDKLYGNDGKDFLFGEFGNDYLNGGDGDDFLLGGGGKDELWGGFGNDVLHGGDGNDVLTGQDGNDLLIGGDGNDSFVFALSGFGDDIIQDFDVGQDIIDLRLTGATNFDSLMASAIQDGANLVLHFDLDGQSSTITLRNVAFTELSASDFLIV